MKQTFNTKRDYRNSYYPYIIYIDGKVVYIFEVTKKTSLRQILKIRKAFKGYSLGFAFIDESLVEHRTKMIDCSNYYFADKEDLTPIYFYSNEQYYKVKISNIVDTDRPDFSLSEEATIFQTYFQHMKNMFK